MVSSSSDDRSATNKGVNVHSESLPTRVHGYSETEQSSVRSFTDIRNEMQQALDLMVPISPNFHPSSDADNEESSLSSEKRTKSSKTAESSTKRSEKGSTKRSSKRDSLKVETFSTFPKLDSLDDLSCCEHCLEPPECICGYSNQNLIPPGTERRFSGKSTTHVSFQERCSRSASKTIRSKKPSLLDWLRHRSDAFLKKTNMKPCELYKINICSKEEDGCPKRVVFDLVEGIPKPNSNSVATNTIRNPVERCESARVRDKETKNSSNEVTQEVTRIQKNIYYDSDGNTRVDFYYFDHGNAQYFHTTDTPPIMKCEIIAEKTERYTTRFWAEFFASIHIAVSFCVSFILQFFKFLLYSIVRPIFVGMMQMLSDYFFKPFLTTLFNGIIQPFLIFLYNIATSVRDLCDPVAEALGYFFRELAVLFRAIRLCTYKNTECECNKDTKCEC